MIFLCTSLISAPFVSFYDSYLYLNSADVLFTQEFTVEYQWFREPLYPILLKFVSSLFGKNDFSYTILHSIFFIASIFLISKSFNLLRNYKSLTFILLAIFMFNPYLIAWTSMILQTSLFIFFLSLYTFLFFKFKTFQRINNKEWFFVNLFALSFAIQILAVGLICQLILNTYLLIKFKNKIRIFSKIIFQFIFIFFLIFSWNYYKNFNLNKNDLKLPDYNKTYVSAQQLVLPINKELPENVLLNVLSLLNINFLQNSSPEVERFIKTSFSGEYNCGLWYPSEHAYIIQKISTNTTTNCKNSFSIEIFKKLLPIGDFIWRLSMISILISFLLYFILKDFLIIILNIPSYLYLLIYSFSIFIVDRYTFPLYIYGFANIIYLIQFFLNLSFKKFKFISTVLNKLRLKKAKFNVLFFKLNYFKFGGHIVSKF